MNINVYYFKDENGTGREGYLFAKDREGAYELLQYHLGRAAIQAVISEVNGELYRGVAVSYLPQVGDSDWDVL